MPLTLAQIENEVDTLPSEDKFQLLDHLQRKLVPEQDELDRIWAEEAHKRFLSIKSGKATTYPVEDVMVELRTELACRK